MWKGLVVGVATVGLAELAGCTTTQLSDSAKQQIAAACDAAAQLDSVFKSGAESGLYSSKVATREAAAYAAVSSICAGEPSADPAVLLVKVLAAYTSYALVIKEAKQENAK